MARLASCVLVVGRAFIDRAIYVVAKFVLLQKSAPPKWQLLANLQAVGQLVKSAQLGRPTGWQVGLVVAWSSSPS